MTTKIEWTDETWNPVTGCTKVSQGCKNCYAERLWPKVSAAEAKRTGQPARAFTDVRTHPDRLDKPLTWRAPRRVFVNSMSDLFHEDVPNEFIARVFGVMCAAQQHTFQILTKRAGRMREWMTRAYQILPDTDQKFTVSIEPLRRIWLGVSVEDRSTWVERVSILRQTSAEVRFVSYEPALGPLHDIFLEDIHWIIAGGESGPNARPAHPDWFRSVRDQCAAAGVAFFFKQWGEWAPCDIEVNAGDGPLRELHPHEESVADAIANSERGFKVIEEHGMEFFRAGKKIAGRHLDGRTHDEYPA